MSNDQPTEITAEGTRIWRNAAGKIHRDDGPAIERPNGDKLWYRNGLLHREDGGPAIDHASGGKGWYRNGRLHRKGGPAVERADGTVEYWLNGVHCEYWLEPPKVFAAPKPR